MKLLTLRIKPKVAGPQGGGGPAEVYPVEVELDGAVISAWIPAREIDVDQKSLVLDPGAWNGRKLGVEDPDDDGPAPNAEFAGWLVKTVFRDSLAAVWAELSRPDQREVFRIVLDVGPQSLLRFRWEQMGDGACYPARIPGWSVVRGRFGSGATDPVGDGPIRMLVVVGSKPQDERVLAEEEVAALREVLEPRANEIAMEVMERPSRFDLSDRYLKWKPDILHFIGHGRVDPQDGGNGAYLVLHSPTGAGHADVNWLYAEMLGDLGRHKPALVFLNACHTADAASREAVWSFSDLFIGRLNARAVVGMHAAVSGAAAGRLAAHFYEKLLDGHDVDVALTDARNRVDQDNGGEARRRWYWALPYLRLAVPPDQVLRRAPVVPSFHKSAQAAREFRDTGLFVNRLVERRSFLELLQADADRPTNLMVVLGDREVGKTDLIRCCLQTAASHGRMIKYVLLDHNEAEDDQGLIRLLCDGPPDHLIRRPLPAAAMAPFYQKFNALRDRRPQAERPPASGYPDTPPWDGNPEFKIPWQGGDQEQIKTLYDALADALARVPAAAREERALELAKLNDPAERLAPVDKRPFVLVFDQVSQDSVVPDEFRKFTLPLLLRLKKVPDLVVVIVVANDDTKALGLDDEAVDRFDLEVPVLSPECFRALAMQYYDKFAETRTFQRQRDKVTRVRWEKQIDSVAESYKAEKTGWKPKVFSYIYSTIRGG